MQINKIQSVNYNPNFGRLRDGSTDSCYNTGIGDAVERFYGDVKTTKKEVLASITEKLDKCSLAELREIKRLIAKKFRY